MGSFPLLYPCGNVLSIFRRCWPHEKVVVTHPISTGIWSNLGSWSGQTIWRVSGWRTICFMTALICFRNDWSRKSRILRTCGWVSADISDEYDSRGAWIEASGNEGWWIIFEWYVWTSRLIIWVFRNIRGYRWWTYRQWRLEYNFHIWLAR